MICLAGITTYTEITKLWRSPFILYSIIEKKISAYALFNCEHDDMGLSPKKFASEVLIEVGERFAIVKNLNFSACGNDRQRDLR